MIEIRENIIIETTLSGVTVGAIKTPEGVIFIDSPILPKDVQFWRTMIMKNDCGPLRLHILLDEHFDRTACVVPIKSPVVAHEKTGKAIQNRPTTLRFSVSATGGDWELYPEVGPIQWTNPEITFTQSIEIELDEDPIKLDYHPGPARGAIWVSLPIQKVVFVGDAVVAGEPPFLENADIDQWLEALELLKSNSYKGYTIISGRSGVIGKKEIQEQIRFLNLVRKRMEKFSAKTIGVEQLEKLTLNLLEAFPTPTKKLQEHYKARLNWGLSHYYSHSIH